MTTLYCTRFERQNQSETSYIVSNVSELAEKLKNGHFALIAPPPHSDFRRQILLDNNFAPITIVREGAIVAYMIIRYDHNSGHVKGMAKKLCKQYNIPEYFFCENGILHKYQVNEKDSIQTFEWNIQNILEYLNLPSGEVEFFSGPTNQYNRSVYVWSFE